MSQINFADLADDHPDLKKAVLAFDSWIRSHPGVRIIDPGRVARDLADIDVVDLAELLTLLVSLGKLYRVYKVLTPSGVEAEGEFEDPSKIPEVLPDRFHRYFRTADSDVIQLFRTRS